MIYLDNAATTLKKPPEVRRAMLRAFDNYANAGRGTYGGAMTAAECIYNAREKVAELFGINDPGQVVFTSNATHSLNLAIKGTATCGNCVISGYEHNSVVRPLVPLEKQGVTYSVAESRLFDDEQAVKAFEDKIDKNTKFAVCTHESNVFGYILPIEEIDEVCFKKGIPLIIDASQSAGSIGIKMSSLRATVCICAPGHKGLYGPQGTGVMICRQGETLKTLMEGGTGSVSAEIAQPEFMPDRHECGTQNVPGISGLSAGIDYVMKRTPEAILQHERKLIKYAVEELVRLDGIMVFAAKDNKLQGGVLSFFYEKISAEQMAYQLSNEGVAVRSGIHCSPIAHRTVGTRNGTVRISVSDFTTERDITGFVRAVRKIVR